MPACELQAMPAVGHDEDLASLSLARVERALRWCDAHGTDTVLSLRATGFDVGEAWVQSLQGIATHTGRWVTSAAPAARSCRPQMMRRLDVPTGWSWNGAFTGEGEAPGFEGWAVECCCRQLPEVFRLVATVGFFSTRQNVQVPYPDFTNYGVVIVQTSPTMMSVTRPGPGTLYWNSRDGRQSRYSSMESVSSHSPAYHWDMGAWQPGPDCTSSSSRTHLSWATVHSDSEA